MMSKKIDVRLSWLTRKIYVRRPWVILLVAASAFAAAQSRLDLPVGAQPQRSRSLPVNAVNPPIRLGDPLRGLSAEQLEAFNEGLEDFVSPEAPESGLGPIFNGASCVQCHNGPAPGGSSSVRVTRFGRVDNGVFDPLTQLGGSLLQRFAIDPAAREVVPPQANVVTDRLSTPLFGAGLIDAIPDAAILANAQRRKGDGIGGRAALVTDAASGTQRVGRFGWKAQVATLLAFAGDAYLNEMGITNRLFPEENAPNGDRARLAQFDRVADIEDAVDPVTGKSDIDRLADFMRLLAPPARLAATASSQSGERIFGQVGCASCHQPTMLTGPSAIPALDRQTVALYSDLLLHDMGSLGDGIAQVGAGMREMRTAPLWGLRARNPFLHDGRATTIDAAIRAHDGEAARVRDRYLGLTPDQQRQLRDFLMTL
jgi:CxxC motif-containing protein (DUF1111 family)